MNRLIHKLFRCCFVAAVITVIPLFLGVEQSNAGAQVQDCDDIFDNINTESRFWDFPDGPLPGKAFSNFCEEQGVLTFPFNILETGDLVLMAVNEGRSYSVTTCSTADFDTYLRVWSASDFTLLAENDNGPPCIVDGSTVTFTSPFDGDVWIGVSEVTSTSMCDITSQKSYTIRAICSPVADSDNDGVTDDVDNCPNIANADQANLDGDTLGDVCDDDRDGDGVLNDNDAFPDDASESADNDGDGVGDNADTDDDNDGQTDADELACGSDPLNELSLAADFDSDSIPDCVDKDDDNDLVPDTSDVCPATVIPEGVPTSSRGLNSNRWALFSSDGVFTQAGPQAGQLFIVTTELTRGCSCEQIIAASGLGDGHTRYGCSTSAVLDWINNP